MPKSGSLGSVRGAGSNACPYREKRLSLVKYLSAGRQRRSGWQAPVGTPQKARWPETAAGSESTARSETEASRDLGDPLRSWSVLRGGSSMPDDMAYA